MGYCVSLSKEKYHSPVPKNIQKSPRMTLVTKALCSIPDSASGCVCDLKQITDSYLTYLPYFFSMKNTSGI